MPGPSPTLAGADHPMKRSLSPALALVLPALVLAAAGCEARKGLGAEDVVGSDELVVEGRRGRRAVSGGEPASLWVVDAVGVAAGLLIRRGSDNNLADRAIYDIITVYDPPSGLFYDLTMSDGVVRYPGTTFFWGPVCAEPVGLGVGGCTDCRAGYGIGFRHEGAWYRVVGGSTFELASAGSTKDSGLAEGCVVHGTTNAKVFPVELVAAASPPLTFVAPLHFEVR